MRNLPKVLYAAAIRPGVEQTSTKRYRPPIMMNDNRLSNKNATMPGGMSHLYNQPRRFWPDHADWLLCTMSSSRPTNLLCSANNCDLMVKCVRGDDSRRSVTRPRPTTHHAVAQR